MTHVQVRTLLACALTAVLSACASYAPMRDADRLALYQAHAGAPVRDISYFNPMSWEEIDDDHIVVRMRPTQSWLMRISGPCLRLGDGSPVIAISSQAGRTSSGFDRVSVSGSEASCRIEEIRPVDLKAVSAARNSA